MLILGSIIGVIMLMRGSMYGMLIFMFIFIIGYGLGLAIMSYKKRSKCQLSNPKQMHIMVCISYYIHNIPVAMMAAAAAAVVDDDDVGLP